MPIGITNIAKPNKSNIPKTKSVGFLSDSEDFKFHENSKVSSPQTSNFYGVQPNLRTDKFILQNPDSDEYLHIG